MKKLLIILFLRFVLSSGSGFPQNAPISTAGNGVTNGAVVTLPVTAVNFNDITSFNLKLTYDPTVAMATLVTPGPLLGGTMAAIVSVPGLIGIAWFTYPGIALPDSSLLFTVRFSRVSTGTTPVAFDDSANTCRWSDGNNNPLNDIPDSLYYISGSVFFQPVNAPLTSIPRTQACAGTLTGVPVNVSSFNSIGSIALNLQYDTSSLVYQSFINNSDFPGFSVDGTVAGTIVATGLVSPANQGITLPDGSPLFTMQFLYRGDTTDLHWSDTGPSCRYTGPPPYYYSLNDTPADSFYFNGSVIPAALPVAAGPITSSCGGNVCRGQTGVTFSVSPVENAVGYNWALPPGGIIISGANTQSILVDFNSNVTSGVVLVNGSNACGSGPASPVYPIRVTEEPVIASQPESPPIVTPEQPSASFKVGASGDGLAWQWQEFTSSWAEIFDGGVYTGARSDSLTITNPPHAMDGNRYRCMVTGTCGLPAVSDGLAKLSISPGFAVDDYRELSWASRCEMNKLLAMNVYPNPVINQSTLSYYLPEPGSVRLVIYNTLGQPVKVLEESPGTRGLHHLKLSSDFFVKGIYSAVLSLKTQNESQLKTIEFICSQ